MVSHWRLEVGGWKLETGDARDLTRALMSLGGLWPIEGEGAIGDEAQDVVDGRTGVIDDVLGVAHARAVGEELVFVEHLRRLIGEPRDVEVKVDAVEGRAVELNGRADVGVVLDAAVAATIAVVATVAGTDDAVPAVLVQVNVAVPRDGRGRRSLRSRAT